MPPKKKSKRRDSQETERMSPRARSLEVDELSCVSETQQAAGTEELVVGVEDPLRRRIQNRVTLGWRHSKNRMQVIRMHRIHKLQELLHRGAILSNLWTKWVIWSLHIMSMKNVCFLYPATILNFAWKYKISITSKAIKDRAILSNFWILWVMLSLDVMPLKKNLIFQILAAILNFPEMKNFDYLKNF